MGSRYSYDTNTVLDIFHDGAAKWPDKPLYRYYHDGVWKEMSWSDAVGEAEAMASYLIQLEVQPGDILSIYSENRPEWSNEIKIGKTLVSSSMIDRVAKSMNRDLAEVPVGFKWFVDGLLEGTYGFGGEESAGASFLRKDGTVWSTDKDGIILNLLAAEITAKTGKDPAEHYRTLESEFGSPVYERLDAPATPDEKKKLANLSPEQVAASEMAGEEIIQKLTHAPGNNAPIGGLKVVTENGWFAARPSGTEDIYKIYTESFKGKEHLKMIQDEAKSIVKEVLSE